MITHREAFALLAVWLVILATCSAAAFFLGRRWERAGEDQEEAEPPGWGKRAWTEANEPGRGISDDCRFGAHEDCDGCGCRCGHPPWRPSRPARRFTGNAWPQPPIGRLSRPPRPSLSPAGERATDFIRAITAQTDAYIREMSR